MYIDKNIKILKIIKEDNEMIMEDCKSEFIVSGTTQYMEVFSHAES